MSATARRPVVRGGAALCVAALVALIGLVEVVNGTTARADSASCDPSSICSDWDGTQWNAHPATFADDGSLTLDGVLKSSHITRNFDAPKKATVSTSDTLPSACVAPSPGTPSVTTDPWTIPPGPSTGEFELGVAIDCNGSYDVSATFDTNHPADGTITLTTSVTVARPAPAVSNVKGTAASDRTVTLSWSAAEPSPTPHDFTGYTITRSPAFSKPVTVDPGTKSFKDTTVPNVGGTFTYTVTANRGQMTSSASSAKVTVQGDGSGPPLSTPDNTVPTGPGGTPATTPSGGSLPIGTGTHITSSGHIGSSHGSTSGAPAPAPAQGPDEGYSTDLPYEQEGGAVAAQLPADSQGGEVSRSGLLVPFAVALVLGVWGVLVLYVTRQASVNEAALSLLDVQVE